MPDPVIVPTPAPAPAPAPSPTPAPAPTPDPAPAPSPAPAPTLIGGKPGDPPAVEPKVVAPAVWPENWRDQLAEQVKPGDKAYRARLDRFATVADVAKNGLGLEQRVSAGELKAAVPFPDKGTDAEKSTWREAQGVPAKPEDYKIELKGGMVVGEADKPIVDEFSKWAHGQHWDNGRLNSTLQFYYELQDKQSQQLAEVDSTRHQQSEDALRAELGTDYRRTVNAVDNFISGWPEPLVKQLQGARDADGGLLFDNPLFIRAMASTALELNPAATLVPAGEGGAKGVADRLAEIRKFATENPDKYDADKGMQAEQTKLIDAQLKLQGRGKAA